MRRNSKPTDPRILLYKERTASECMNAAFDFIRSNWKILLRYSLYLILPVSIIQTVGIVTVVDSAIAHTSEPPMADLIAFILFGTLGFVLLNALIWTMVKLYHDRPDGLVTVTSSIFWHQFWPILGRMAVAVVPLLLILLPVLVISAVIQVFIPIAFFAYMVLALPVLLISPIFALERVSLFEAIKRAFVMGFRQMGALILMALTLVVMVYVLEGVVMLPWGLLIALKSFFADPTLATLPIVDVLVKSLFNLFSVLFCYVTYFSVAVVLISGAYLYGSSVQQREDKSLLTDIDNFENL